MYLKGMFGSESQTPPEPNKQMKNTNNYCPLIIIIIIIIIQILLYSTEIFEKSGIRNGDIVTVIIGGTLLIGSIITVR